MNLQLSGQSICTEMVDYPYLMSWVTYYYTASLLCPCVEWVEIWPEWKPLCRGENPVNHAPGMVPDIPILLKHFLLLLKHKRKEIKVGKTLFQVSQPHIYNSRSLKIWRNLKFLTGMNNFRKALSSKRCVS